MDRPTILLQRTHPEAQTPCKYHSDDVGFDLVFTEDVWLMPFKVKDISTGWNVKIPHGFWGSIKTRSSTFFRKRLLVLEAVIDPNYTGSLSVVIFNPTFLPRRIRKGERLAQLILHVSYDPAFKLVTQNMPVTSRNSNRFGSTGG